MLTALLLTLSALDVAPPPPGSSVSPSTRSASLIAAEFKGLEVQLSRLDRPKPWALPLLAGVGVAGAIVGVGWLVANAIIRGGVSFIGSLAVFMGMVAGGIVAGLVLLGGLIAAVVFGVENVLLAGKVAKMKVQIDERRQELERARELERQGLTNASVLKPLVTF